MRFTVGGILAVGAVLAACSVDDSGSVPAGRSCRALTAQQASAASLESPFQGTVFTIVLENKSKAQMFNGKDAPYLRSLAAQGAIASGYRDARVHPSEPNYIWMVSGQNFGILDDKAPSAHHIAGSGNIADQLEAVGKTWKAYEESMGEPCGVVSRGTYAVKHDPFVFFDDVVGWDSTGPLRQQRCLDHVVDYSELDADLAADSVPAYAFITPNLIDDMHDGTIAQGDAWLRREVPKILASNAYQNGGVLFITADEGQDRSATNWSQEDDPPFLVLSPMAKPGYVSKVTYDTSSYLKTVQAIEGVEALPCGDAGQTVDTMDDLFQVPVPAMVASPGA